MYKALVTCRVIVEERALTLVKGQLYELSESEAQWLVGNKYVVKAAKGEKPDTPEENLGEPETA